MEDAGIIELLFARSEQGIRELDAKYGGTCRQLPGHRGADGADGEKCLRPADPPPPAAEALSDGKGDAGMNGEKFTAAMGQIGDRYVEEALFYAAPSAANVRRRRLGVLLAAVIATLALCGFASYELGLLDPWFQTPSDDPVQVVRSAIEGQADKAYTICVRVEEIAVDETETARAAAMYGGSELAEARGWTDAYLAEHFVAVRARYYTAYDHTKTFMNDGYTEQYFYLTRDARTGKWGIAENTAPNTGARP